jgi:integrase
LQKLYNDKLNNGRKDKKKVDGKLVEREGGLSPRTIRYMHVIIHSALKQAVDEKIIQSNVSEHVKLPKNPKKEMKTLHVNDIKKFLEFAKVSRYYTAFLFELYTGLRRGELLGIRWKDIDFKNCKIKVVQQLVKEGNNHVIRELKTNKSQNRVISIPSEIVQELKNHKKIQAEERKQLGLSEIYDGLVFTCELGTYVQTRSFDRALKGILKRANLEKIRIHDLRHTFALISLQSGTDIKTLQNDLGHESISTTLDEYGHVNEEMKRDASNKRSQLMKGLLSKTQ